MKTFPCICFKFLWGILLPAALQVTDRQIQQGSCCAPQRPHWDWWRQHSWAFQNCWSRTGKQYTNPQSAPCSPMVHCRKIQNVDQPGYTTRSVGSLFCPCFANTTTSWFRSLSDQIWFFCPWGWEDLCRECWKSRALRFPRANACRGWNQSCLWCSLVSILVEVTSAQRIVALSNATCVDVQSSQVN